MNRDCERFREALDRRDPEAQTDSHPDSCFECAVERRAAAAMQQIVARRPAPGAPVAFAARVAYLARVEAAEQAARARRARAPSPAIAWTTVAASAFVAGLMAFPILKEIAEVFARTLAVKISLPPGPAAIAAVWLSFTSALAFDLVRRLRPAR